MIDTRVERHEEASARTTDKGRKAQEPRPGIGVTAVAECECPDLCQLDHDN